MPREHFLLNPDIIFLNHGSFGACPRPVFEVYQQWQREMESQPVEFLGRRYDALLDDARAQMAAYLAASPDDLVFVPNATVGINTVARSLELQPGDEILTTHHEYGAMDFTWQAVCQKTGARYIVAEISTPIESDAQVIAQLWAHVTPHTRVLFFSHITSPTALSFPAAALCQKARESGILTVIDGAHAPGQIAVNLVEIDADFYTGNCHKWLCAPKGAGFLYVRRDQQPTLEPLITSWGWPESNFVRRNQWQGTRDIAAFLSVPAAIAFQERHNWPDVRRQCHAWALNIQQQITHQTGLPPLSGETHFAQMVSVPLPETDLDALKRALYDDYRIEVPLIRWNGQSCVRVSFQGYNTPSDGDALVRALTELL